MRDADHEYSGPAGDLAKAAEGAFVAGDTAKAAKLFEQLTQENPDNFRFLFNLGSCLANLGNHAAAIVAYKQALQRNPLEADTLYFLGLSYLDCNLPEDAEKFFTCCLSVDPAYVRVHGGLARAAMQLGKMEQAIASYRKALDSEADRETAAHMLAALCGEKTERAPARYVQSLFDDYASCFEQSLTGIGYNIPWKLRSLFDNLFGRAKRFQNALDLGCGTGLSGSAFYDLTERMVGIDLSARMLREAEEKGIYDHLEQQDLVTYLKECGEFFDLFLLTDVLVYLGHLTDLFRAIGRRALPQALLLFSVEKGDGAGYQLRPTGRYAHSRQYLEDLAYGNGFEIEACRATGIRKENEKWIEGEIYILSRP
ncbi:MAG: tetratricopeptide repeat protein [Deltaproteobacteria bacterium]